MHISHNTNGLGQFSNQYSKPGVRLETRLVRTGKMALSRNSRWCDFETARVPGRIPIGKGHTPCASVESVEPRSKFLDEIRLVAKTSEACHCGGHAVTVARPVGGASVWGYVTADLR